MGRALRALRALGLLCCLPTVLNAPGVGRRDWSHGRTRQVVLFASGFAGSNEGWTLEAQAHGSPPPRDVTSLLSDERSLVTSDDGPSVWYFTSPGSWAGDRSAAYNGELFLKLWHPGQPPAGTHAAKVTKSAPDLILETTCGFSVAIHNIFPAPRISSAVYSIPLSEEAASWVDSRTKRRITRIDLLVALSNLRAIKIRGGFLQGAETARLADFRVVPPAQGLLSRADVEPCCSPSGRMDVCQRAGPPNRGFAHHAEGLTFPGLGFECGGSLVTPESRPRVRYVHPKSSRRSGGARITVFGENFGFYGKSYVRIAGKRTDKCVIPRAQHCANGILDFDEQNIDCGGQNCQPCTFLHPHCSNGVMDRDEDKKDCGGKDCERCSIMTFEPHCTNGIRDFDEIAVDRGGEDCLPNFCFDYRIAGDKRDRVNNCGGSCQPCFPKFSVAPDTVSSQIAICDAPGDSDVLEDAQVSFTVVDEQTSHETSSCFNDEADARGFVFDGVDNAWSLHLSALDTQSQSDVNVTAIAVDDVTGDCYVTASVTRQLSQGDGRITVVGKDLDKRGFWEPGSASGVGSADEFSLPSDGGGNPVTDNLIHTVILKVSMHGKPQWITYMESQNEMLAEDVLVDTSARPTRIIIAGLFKGYYPRFYHVNPLTKRAKRGEDTERGGGIRCTDATLVTNPEECWYLQGEPNYSHPTTGGTIQPLKPGIFLVSYSAAGVATASKGGIYFRSTGTSFPLPGTVRIAAHTTAVRNSRKNGSNADESTAFVTDSNGLYLTAKILVSRYKDEMYFGEQSPGYSRVGKGFGCERRIVNATHTACDGGADIQRDVMMIGFPEIIPTPKDDTSWAFIAKYVAGTRTFGAVWVRLIGEVGTNRRSCVSGLEADENGVYIAGAFTAGAVTNLSYQTCEFGAQLPECEPGGRLYDSATGLCSLQEAYTRAPNQVCAKFNTSLLDRHIVRTHDFRKYSDTRRQGMFLASYDHRGVLRWHREAFGGNITVAGIALSKSKDVMVDYGRGRPRRSTRVSRRGRFVYVTGLVLQYLLNKLDENGEIGNVAEFTNFGQMRYPLSCSQNKNVVAEIVNVTATVSVVGDYDVGPIYTPCSGRITSMGSGSDIYVVQFSADDGEPQWLKRFGQRDAWEYVTDIDLNRRYSTVYITGSFVATSSGLQDVFGMEAAGRLDLISCPLWSGPVWNAASSRFEYEHMSNESTPSCKLVPFSSPNSMTGFVMEIGEGNTETPGEKPWEQMAREAAEAAATAQAQLIAEQGPTGEEVPITIPWTGAQKAASSAVGASSLPFSQCLLKEESACNTDGILWVRTLHVKEFTTYETFAPQNPARKIASGHEHLIVGGVFEGVTVANTKMPYGLQTQGVDDIGFFNMRDDNVETYITTLAA